MEEANNPAGILLSKMTRALSLKNETPMPRLWAHVFECESNESILIVQGLSNLMRLCHQAEEAVRVCAPGAPDLYIQPLGKIRALVSDHDLNATWTSYRSRLDASTMTSLQFCDHLLQQEYKKEYPGKSALIHDLLTDLDKLLQSCLNSEMGPELKTLFAKNLEELRGALIRYRIGEEEALRKAVDQVAGSILRHSIDIKKEFDNAEEFLDKSLGIMGKIEMVVAKSQDMLMLASPITTYLLPFFK